MTIDDLVRMAHRIHHAEQWDLGARSSRETRNAFWARVIGCAHHGHGAYNPTPDPQWHLKSAGGGRPQSDDVAVSLPSREFWDCIGGVGADGYTFGVWSHSTPLPPEQEVFAPPVPSGVGPAPTPEPMPEPTPQPACRYQPPDLSALDALDDAARDAVLAVQALHHEVAALRVEVQALRDTARPAPDIAWPIYQGTLSLPGWLGGGRPITLPITLTPQED